MTTEEKLKHFLDITVEEANQKSKKTLEEYRKGLDTIFESFRQDSLRQQEAQLKASSENLKKEINMELAEYQIGRRKSLSDKQEEMKSLLFQEIEQELVEFKKTRAYDDYLLKHIQQALHFARQEPIEIYLDPEDVNKKEELEQQTGAEIRISEYGFFGGIRAVIRSKRVLIDQSFETKLAEEKNEFLFRLN